MVKKRLSVGAQGFERLQEMMRLPEAYSGREIPCGLRYTDFPYGKATWTAGQNQKVIEFNTGCQAPEAGAVHNALYEADKLVKEWAAEAQIIEETPNESP